MNIFRIVPKLSIPIAILLGALLPGAAFTQNNKIDPGIMEYSRTYGVSLDEAKSRAYKEDYAFEVGRRIEVNSPKTFAGIYIEHEPTFRVVVRFVGDAKTQLAKYTHDPLFVPQTAPRSLEVLLAAQADIADQLVKHGIDFTSGIDLKKSEVTLYVQDPVAVRKQFAIAFRVSPFIRVYKGSGSSDITEISGGRRVIDQDQASCTTGFNVFDGNRELGITTAGHCENSLTYASPRKRLSYQGESDGGSYDIQWNNQRTSSQPEQQKNSIDLIQGPAPSMEVTSVTSSNAYGVGKFVCKSGISGYFKCGTVANMHHLENYRGAVGSYIQVHNANNEPLAVEGDSGGPVFGVGDNSAYGVIHARGNIGDPDRNDLFYMPIERLSVLGISVLTEPFEITSIPDASGPNDQEMPITVNFKGVPRFPVTVTVDVLTCPEPWVCTGASGDITTNVPSPFVLGWICDGAGLPTTSFQLQTTLKDASLIQPSPVQHVVTCLAGPALESHRVKSPMQAGAVIISP